MVEHTSERTLGRLLVRIDRTLCVGFGDCIGIAPDVFVLDDEGIVAFCTDISEVEEDRLLLACDICPVDALSVFDPEGQQLVP